jgi:translocation and assembly module TamA
MARPHRPPFRLIAGGLLALSALAGLAGSAARGADPQAYTVKITPTGNAALDAALSGTSNLVNLRSVAPVAPFALISRAQQDNARLVTALDSFGYYDGKIAITIDGHPPEDPALPDLLQNTPSGTAVPVVVTATLGPLFHLRHVGFDGHLPADAAAKLAPLAPGAPAVAADVLAAQGRVLTQLREDGYALAKVEAPVAVLVPAAQALDVTFPVTTGPHVDLGPIAITGLSGVNPGVVRRRLLVHQGEPFSPSKIEAARQDLASLGVFSSVQAEAGTRLDPQGQLPLTFAVEEAKRHVVSVGGSYSTDLGFQGTLSWTDRNLFGNAEQLRFSAANTELGGSSSTSPGYDITGSFIKPDFLARDQSLEIDLEAIKEDLDAYDRTAGTYGVLLNRKLSPHWTGSIGVAGETERIEQEGVVSHYSLLGLPLVAKYDSTDSLLAPTKGDRAAFSATPTESIPLGGAESNATFALLQASASTYLDFSGMFGEKIGQSILALRGMVGSAQGAELASLPPDKRFYAGGSATVRGYKYQSIGPQFPDHNPVGGLAVAAATLEWRQRIWGNIGAAAFVDAGQVSTSSAPFGGTPRVGAGLGARYYTPIGPIRVDFAVPLNKEPGGDAFEVYIGLGEAF